jgi:Fe-S cluster biosynthesis and repair protein YggX
MPLVGDFITSLIPDQLDELIYDEISRKRLAKWMARDCLRENTEHESFHDRIEDSEMKKLMIGVVNNCYLFLSILSSAEASATLIELMNLKDPLPQWNDPKLPWKRLRSAEQLRDIIDGRQREAAARHPLDSS